VLISLHKRLILKAFIHRINRGFINILCGFDPYLNFKSSMSMKGQYRRGHALNQSNHGIRVIKRRLTLKVRITMHKNPSDEYTGMQRVRLANKECFYTIGFLDVGRRCRLADRVM
jgi:hypothetical protein